MFFSFVDAAHFMEFNKQTKQGLMHKLGLQMIVESKNLKTPSSWHTSKFKKIVNVIGETMNLILMEEEQK